MKVYLIHGWGASPESEKWYLWFKEECKKRNIEISIPKMPDSDSPEINEWVGKLRNIVEVSEKTYLVGHSIGCQAIMRFLGQIDKKVGGVIFVAGWFNLLNTAYENEEEKDIAKSWLETPINYNKVRKNAGKILAIFSSDDGCVPVSDSELFKERLSAKIIIKENEGHFNNTKKIKEIIEFIEK